MDADVQVLSCGSNPLSTWDFLMVQGGPVCFLFRFFWGGRYKNGCFPPHADLDRSPEFNSCPMLLLQMTPFSCLVFH